MYAQKASDVFARLRGTYSVPVTAPVPNAAGGSISTDLQKSIFGAPPGTGAATLPNKPPEAATTQGVKRPREGESDEDEAPMDEDSDVPMEASSDEE